MGNNELLCVRGFGQASEQSGKNHRRTKSRRQADSVPPSHPQTSLGVAPRDGPRAESSSTRAAALIFGGDLFLMMAMNEPRKLRLGVLLSGGGRTLTNLLQQIDAGRLAAQVTVVIASRPCKGIDLAQQARLPVHLVSRKQITDDREYSDRITALLDDAGVDLVVMAGFLSLWTIPLPYLGRVINIHPALLPSFGGKGMFGHHVHEAVLHHGCKVSGCTVHFVTNEYDQGPIILQKCVPVLEGDTPDTLAARVFEQECIALPQAIALCAAGRVRIDGNVVRISD